MSAKARSDELEVEPGVLCGWLEEGAGVQMIDVREPYEREAGHIADSRHIELSRLPEEAPTIDPGRPVVVYCRVGQRSAMATQALRAAGYEAYSMAGGLVRWAAEGRPLEPKDGYVAGH